MSMIKIWLGLAVTALGLGPMAAGAAAVPGVGPGIASYALRLHLLWVCAAIAAVVYAVMVYGLVAAKRPRGTVAPRASSRRAELLWALIPAAILVGLALPAVETLADLAAETTGQGGVVVVSPADAQ